MAVKIQFPTLKLQTYYDMKVASFWVRTIDRVANILDFKGIKLEKLYKDFEESRMTELDFELELKNGLKTTENFKDDDRIYIPKFYEEYSGPRTVTMEYIGNTLRIDDVNRILKRYGENNTNIYV